MLRLELHPERLRPAAGRGATRLAFPTPRAGSPCHANPTSKMLVPLRIGAAASRCRTRRTAPRPPKPHGLAARATSPSRASRNGCNFTSWRALSEKVFFLCEVKHLLCEFMQNTVHNHFSLPTHRLTRLFPSRRGRPFRPKHRKHQTCQPAATFNRHTSRHTNRHTQPPHSQ